MLDSTHYNNFIPISDAFKTQLITGILSAPILYIPTSHYNYVDSALIELLPEKSQTNERSILGLYSNTICEYDMGRRVIDFETKKEQESRTKLSGILNEIIANNINNGIYPEHKIILIKNIARFRDNPTASSFEANDLNSPNIQLLLQTFAEKYERDDYDRRTTVILVSPVPASMLPKEIIDIVSVIEIKPPTIEQIERCVSKIEVSKQFEIEKDTLIPDLCRTLQGLSFYEIQQVLNSALVRTGGRLTANTRILALEEKKNIVKKSGIIEVIDSEVSLNDIGGLDSLCDDMRQKAIVFRNLRLATDPEAGIRLPLPKGILIVGMPGCGKTMIAKAIAREFGVSLLRLDISNLMGKYVGESEENLRKALATAEAAHPCVLWIDEIEKAFHGASNSGGSDTDNLVMRMMGYFLTWMQERNSSEERQKAVYIVATANDVMRPELMRKGRFDEVYFVDFPNQKERAVIFEKKIKRFHNTPEHKSVFDFSKVLDSIGEIAKMAVPENPVEGHDDAGFSGAEIDSLVNSILEKKFAEYAKALENEEHPRTPIVITKDDFTKEIQKMKKHVLSGQVSKKSGDKRSHVPTQIENIYAMNDIYQFTPASKKTTDNDTNNPLS